MKRERLFTCMEATVTGFFLSFSAIACLVTAFAMTSVNLWWLALSCLCSALLCSWLCSRHLELIMAGLIALIAGILWQSGLLTEGIESVLYTVSRTYSDAYRWQIVQWSGRGAYAMEQTLAPVLYAAGGLLASLTAWTICRGQSSIVACLPTALPVAACFVVTDSLPAIIWLFLFLCTMVVMMLTSTTRQADRTQGRRLAVITAIPVILAVGVLFLAVPRQAYYHQNKAKTIGDFLLGKYSLEQMLQRLQGEEIMPDTKKVDLCSVGIRKESRSPILNVTSRSTGGTLYLRVTALDRYTGTQWLESLSDVTQLYWPLADSQTQVDEVRIKTEFAHEMLYMPYYTTSIDTTTLTRGIPNTDKLNEYSITRILADPVSVLYADNRTPTDAQRLQMESLSRLPDDTRKWASALAKTIVGDENDPYYQALMIAEYVKRSARYNLNTNPMPAGKQDFAKWFLEESDTGYCIHFASAATVLLKSLGIPARYVTGYMTQTTAGEPTQVLASQAHAWVEYWLPGFGWTVLECTPSAQEIQDFQNQAQQAATQVDHAGSGSTTAPQQEDHSSAGLWWLLIIPAAPLGLWIQRKVRLVRRTRRLRRGNSNHQALARWTEAERLLRHLGQTPPEHLHQLAEKAKFSPYTITPEELAQFDNVLQAAVTGLKKQSFLRRLWHKWILVLY